MGMRKTGVFVLAVLAIGALASCGARPSAVGGGNTPPQLDKSHPEYTGPNRSTIWDIFKPSKSENVVPVNKYLWRASLDILNFLPIQTIDPYTGVIVTGYGTPPGGGRAYRATVYISDPALEARALKVSLQTRRGPVAGTTQRAVEDAILARARQLRGKDGRF